VLGWTVVGAAGCNRDACKGKPSFEPPPEPNPGPNDPPTVIGGRWLDETVLELQFSKPIAAPNDLDPRRFAIVGWAAYVDSDSYFKFGIQRCYSGTTYAALLGREHGNLDELIVEASIVVEDDTRLRLRLSAPGQCESEPYYDGSGVMLVYTDGHLGGSSALHDLDGVRLAKIGPMWAIERLEECLAGRYSCTYTGFFESEHLPAFDTLARIPCP